MGGVQLILFHRAGRVDCVDLSYAVPESSLVIADVDAIPRLSTGGETAAYAFNTGELQVLYRDLIDLLAQRRVAPFFREPVKQLGVSTETIEVIARLGGMSRIEMLRFAYMYCLGVEQDYFSRLLYYFVDSSRDFFEFVESNSMNSWPVSQYADELGISLRKLNLLFYEKCGVSAKHWLLERRLRKARELLLGSVMKVTDIAQECGFNSHAHFSDSFRRRYNDCPRGLRQKGSQLADSMEDGT
ncbi:hypothetical protein EOS_35525 [Caballeronia mineralivorans PML1(12)]|uniref:HTH araC/xylS-type domain-containing protein n=1 Tax=Caballeronia mineralivorans PML1(12) TaxID=908627 RepID=A0A0J1CL87_9BURK|nr:AraC family transcriptional regulator [Caballeronia mineralivorans]KLU21487.1 hypothetical protein EOS_35525 [Caballeronia mineralivorans PML1(12)]